MNEIEKAFNELKQTVYSTSKLPEGYVVMAFDKFTALQIAIREHHESNT